MQSFTVRNIFEGIHSKNWEFQESNCVKIEAAMNRYLHEVIGTGRLHDNVLDFICEKHGVNLGRNQPHYR